MHTTISQHRDYPHAQLGPNILSRRPSYHGGQEGLAGGKYPLIECTWESRRVVRRHVHLNFRAAFLAISLTWPKDGRLPLTVPWGQGFLQWQLSSERISSVLSKSRLREIDINWVFSGAKLRCRHSPRRRYSAVIGWGGLQSPVWRIYNI